MSKKVSVTINKETGRTLHVDLTPQTLPNGSPGYPIRVTESPGSSSNPLPGALGGNGDVQVYRRAGGVLERVTMTPDGRFVNVQTRTQIPRVPGGLGKAVRRDLTR